MNQMMPGMTNPFQQPQPGMPDQAALIAALRNGGQQMQQPKPNPIGGLTPDGNLMSMGDAIQNGSAYYGSA